MVLNWSSLTGKICGSPRPKQAICVFLREFEGGFLRMPYFGQESTFSGQKGHFKSFYGQKCHV